MLLRLASAAAAGPASAPARHGSGAAAALEKGKAALQDRDYGAARSALEQAYRLAAAPEVLFLLGRVAEADGRTLEAHDLMRRFLADPARRPDETAVAEAQRVVKLARPPSGQVVVLGAPGSQVLVDERLRGSVPLAQPLLLSPGEHRIGLQLGNRRLDSPVPVQAGRSFEVRFNAASGAVLITQLPAVLWVTEQVGVPEEAQNPLADAAEQAARAANQTLLAADAALARAPAPSDCLSRIVCQQELARKNEVEYVLNLQATYKIPTAGKPDAAALPRPVSNVAAAAQSAETPQGAAVIKGAAATQDAADAPGAGAAPATGAPRPEAPQGSWQMQLSLWHVDIATPAATRPAECLRCTPEQAAAVLKQTALELLGAGLHRGHGRFAITSEPPSVQVRIDGKDAGMTPYAQAAWTGTYNVELRRPGFEPAQRSIEVGEDKSEQLTVTLIPLVGLETAPVAVDATKSVLPPLRRPAWRLGTGAGLLGVGILFIGIGGAAANIVGQCAAYSDFGVCTEVFDTAGTAGGLLTTGSLMTVAGIVLLALPPTRPKFPR